jgi:hypothetical protein
VQCKLLLANVIRQPWYDALCRWAVRQVNGQRLTQQHLNWLWRLGE